jgi:hypothetical protein
VPPIVRQQTAPLRTGLRALDDLIAGPAPPPETPTAPSLRAATPYETYVQPAVLGLRSAATSAFHALVGSDPNDQLAATLHPLTMAEAPIRRGAQAGAHWLGDAADRALRGLRGEADEAIHTLDPRAGAALNASGDSAASLESLGRRGWERSTGRQLVRLDRSGRATPFLGEPGDITPNPGERIGYRLPDGTFEEVSRGR